MNTFGVPRELLAELEEVERHAAAVKAKISEAALTKIGFKKGDVVRDKESGLHYRLESCSVYVSAGKVGISVMGRRMWKSGRKAGREAHSSSWLTYAWLEKVETTDEPV